MSSTRALVHLPPVLKAGQVFLVRATVQHAMESGFRAGSDGRVLPRDIVRRFEARVDGVLAFAADLHPAIAANPYLAFPLRLERSAELVLHWQGDGGFDHRETRRLDVQPA